jgi:hypothetical protein
MAVEDITFEEVQASDTNIIPTTMVGSQSILKSDNSYRRIAGKMGSLLLESQGDECQRY